MWYMYFVSLFCIYIPVFTQVNDVSSLALFPGHILLKLGGGGGGGGGGEIRPGSDWQCFSGHVPRRNLIIVYMYCSNCVCKFSVYYFLSTSFS